MILYVLPPISHNLIKIATVAEHIHAHSGMTPLAPPSGQAEGSKNSKTMGSAHPANPSL